MITEDGAEIAAEYIRTHAEKFGKAKASRVYLQEFRKSKKAILMNERPNDVQHVRESHAYAHDEYIQILKGIQVAIEEEETIRWKMVAAEARIDMYRTQQANNRMIDKSHT